MTTLHGDKHQSDRNAALKSFRNGSIPVLIATDVASRGLDVPNVATVVRVDAAKSMDQHVHRVGRAGRANEKGTSYTILTNYAPKDVQFAKSLRASFEREGRPISRELNELAERTQSQSQSRYNKTGVGSAASASASLPAASWKNKDDDDGDFPPAKKRRWG